MKKTVFLIILGLGLTLSGCITQNNNSDQKPEAKPINQNQPPKTNNNQNPQPDKSADSDANTAKQNLQAIIDAGKPMKCTFEQTFTSSDGEEEITKGTVYINQENYLGETTIELKDNNSFTTFALKIDNMMYIRGDMYPQGMSMDLDKMEELTGESMDSYNDTATTGMPNTGLEGVQDFECTPRTPDPDTFTLPTDVQFMDMYQMFQGMQDAFQGEDFGPDYLCDMCLQAPSDEMIQDCLVQNNCN